MSIKAKKHLGQHFLTDENIAKKIVDKLSLSGYDNILEVGPGMGVLTKYILDKKQTIWLAEIDTESIDYLKNNYLKLSEKNFIGDFLKTDFAFIQGAELAVLGNFPYNISSQILFHIIDNHKIIPEMVGMFQKEVAERVASLSGTKNYGTLSVMVQAYYDVKYLFTVHENVFNPPPKVKSGVIKLTRNIKNGLIGQERLFKQIVKSGFNQRRKKLSNSLKTLDIPEGLKHHAFLDKRAEELSIDDFIQLTTDWKSEKLKTQIN